MSQLQTRKPTPQVLCSRQPLEAGFCVVPLCFTPKQDFFLTSSHATMKTQHPTSSNTDSTDSRATDPFLRGPRKGSVIALLESQKAIRRVSKIFPILLPRHMIHPRLFYQPTSIGFPIIINISVVNLSSTPSWILRAAHDWKET